MSTIIYLGFNNPLKHKRGVENVICFQAQTTVFTEKYYIFFDKEKELKYFEWEGIKCILIPHNFYRFLKLNKVIKDIKKRKDKILIHSHNPLMSFFYLGKTDIFTVHDGLYYQNKCINHKLLHLFYIIERIVYKKSKRVHFISNFSKKMSLYKGNKDILINNTTPLESINHTPIDKENIIDKNSKLKLFSVRSIEERANIDLLIDLARKRKDIEIKVAGKGPLYQKYTDLIVRERLNNIKLLGYVTDSEVIALYCDADLIIVPAKYGEGFGLPVIEGYLFNKPVIASNICAIPEIIYKKEHLFNNNVESIENCILNVFNESQINYKEYYNKNYSKYIILKQYDKLYQSCLDSI